MFNLVENEVYKLIYKKRLLIIFAILLVLITAFAYGEKNSLNRTKERLTQRIGISQTNDWHKLLEQQIIDAQNRLENPYGHAEDKPSLRVRLEQLQYFLKNDINPLDSSAAKFTTRFIEQSIFLFLPLLVIVLAGDLVSGEATSGTIKLLLTRNVPRWKILLSKFIALLIMEVIVLLLALVISIGVSGIFFGYGGWQVPVATGFTVIGDNLITTGVQNVPQWQYILMVYGLAYFVVMVIGCISLMTSVLVKSTSASIGVMMSALIGGNLLSYFLADWQAARYLFMVNLRLPSYLSGSFQPVPGIDMNFSVTVLTVWALGAILISFVYFTKQDILV